MKKQTKTIMNHMQKDSIAKPRLDSRFRVRHILPSDNHPFIGRLYDLGIVGLNFGRYEEIEQYPDCKYALDCGWSIRVLTQRVESLNMVRSLLWPSPFPDDFKSYPISPYEWLVLTTDVFLMRYISTVDCVFVLINEVYELGLPLNQCRSDKIKKKVPLPLWKLIEKLEIDQGALGQERHSRVHHGLEREFTDDDRTFKTVSLFEHRANGMAGRDIYGRKINLRLFFREGLVNLQRDFNKSTRQLVRNLDDIYDLLSDEFEYRFGPRIAAATHGLNANSKIQPTP